MAREDSVNKHKKICVVISAHNDEALIEECITSASLLTREIIVIDIESTDETQIIAKKNGAQVYTFPFTLYVEPSRNFSMQKAGPSDWVLILDADERVTKELTQEVKQTIQNADATHFRIPRKNLFGGRTWLKHGGWWPDYQIRLIKKSAFRSWSKQIHSTPVVEGPMGYLTEPLIHLAHGNFEKMVDKTLVFEDIESDLLHKAGKSVSVTTFFRKFVGELFRRLIKHVGFRDGKTGIIESIYQAYSKTITYIMLYEKQHKSGGKEKSQPAGRQGRPL